MARIAALICLFPAVAIAEVEMRFDDGSVAIVSNGRVLFGDDVNSVLYQPGDNDIIVINRAEQTWLRLEPGFADSVTAQMEAQIDALLSSVPPEQRADLRKQIQDSLPQDPQDLPQVTIRKTGVSDTVAGYHCDEAEVIVGGGDVEEEVCIASAAELGIADSDFNALIAAMRGMANIATLNPDAPPQADFGDIGGIPIRTTDREHSADSALVGIDTRSVDTSRFNVPAGFREVSLEELMQRQR